MPEISRFYGIIISMYYDDHNPPHFHVRYSEYSAVIGIHDFALLEGSIPPKAFGLVTEWAAVNKNGLLENWELAKNNELLKKITPLM
ncbi:MAG: DUF4160 domain-containing protein [Ignavibacteria bacterium]|nr:DUF4160 domain-containing protein [Ignavibacteria bacterium]